MDGLCWLVKTFVLVGLFWVACSDTGLAVLSGSMVVVQVLVAVVVIVWCCRWCCRFVGGGLVGIVVTGSVFLARGCFFSFAIILFLVYLSVAIICFCFWFVGLSVVSVSLVCLLVCC